MAPRNNNALENNQTFADNDTPANGHTPANNERVQLEDYLPAAHQFHISEHAAATSAPTQARMVNGEVKRESPAPAIWGNNVAPGSASLEHPLYIGPYEKENNEKKMTLLSESGHEPEEATDAVPPQHRTSIQPDVPWPFIQSTTVRRIATPPIPPALEFGSYRGRRWAECVHYINTMEAHFARYPNYYTEARKVELGAKYISSVLMDKWHNHIIASGNTSWMLYCTFLAQQLSRYANHRQALEGIASASQKIAQPVTHFALWLIQWAPVTPDISSNEFMAYLLRGVLPDIRAHAQKSYVQFSDYNSFAMYLQEVENSTPSRAKFLAKRNNSTASTDEILVSLNMNEAERKPKEILSSEPPTQLRSQFECRLSPEMPAPGDLRLYSARSWRECKTFMSKLQDYFDQYGSHFNEARKIKIGRDNLSRVLLGKWDEHAAHLRTATWFAFCVFLVDQIPSEGAGNFKYTNTYQRVNQSVCTFALELLRWAPPNFGATHNRLRHLWDRVLPEIRSRANKNWEDFDDFLAFLAYLQQVQDSFSIRKQTANPCRPPPTKAFSRRWELLSMKS
ncbi:hypothetical protein N7481_008570 [Penicillium waksmanii]|uniref:uncharacterized protein n=1 Tax=Penicillium waksmanii TaxID=69791 RepID=UPI002548912A|nr:uncharacterized protein N7481_008570 [Penicillium waksmanii]KAJ5974863.1 hypothetical protein N7481_008570 [Penicillium waksmanii]